MWILKWKHTTRNEKFLSLKKDSVCYLYGSKAVQIFLFLYAGCGYTHQSPCLASQAQAELIKDSYANIICNTEWKTNSFAPFFYLKLLSSFLPRHAILYHLPAISATSLTWESDNFLLLANIALKWEITFSCFTQVWLNWNIWLCKIHQDERCFLGAKY